MSSDDDLLNLKVQLIKELFKHNFTKLKIRYILEFIAHYTKFSKKNINEYLSKLEFEKDKITHKKKEAMTIFEVVKEGLIEEAKAEAKAEAIKELIENMLVSDFKIEQIAALLKQPIELVQEIQKELEEKKNN